MNNGWLDMFIILLDTYFYGDSLNIAAGDPTIPGGCHRHDLATLVLGDYSSFAATSPLLHVELVRLFVAVVFPMFISDVHHRQSKQTGHLALALICLGRTYARKTASPTVTPLRIHETPAQS
jgi:hypothetical protein